MKNVLIELLESIDTEAFGDAEDALAALRRAAETTGLDLAAEIDAAVAAVKAA